jgi:chaperonin GroES
MTKVKPLGDRVLLRRRDAETKTPGGLLIPDSAQEKPVICTVEGVGNGVRDMHGTIHPLMVSEGDTVLIGKFAPNSQVGNDPTLIIVREGDILGIVEG